MVMQLKNRRMQQLIFMFSSITGKSEEESEYMIMQTETGKLVLANDRTVLYEQQTENLYSIAMELSQMSEYREIAQSMSNENIIKSMKGLRAIELEKQGDVDKSTLVYLKPDDGVMDKVKERMREKQKEVLKIQEQNRINARRIENADKFKR